MTLPRAYRAAEQMAPYMRDDEANLQYVQVYVLAQGRRRWPVSQ
jgi:hypothetical protein